jgi:NAD(P)-dependent dehydrogenase (short-subunit alcohol dehydrogenase family)
MVSTPRTCVVTGAGRGIGRATALRLTAAGANVLGVARTQSDLDETADLAADHPGTCSTLTADLSRPEEVRRMIDHAGKAFGRLDVLVNNAGLAPLCNIEELDEDTFRALIDINISGVFHACRYAWPLLKASRGTIINISSVAAIDPFAGFAAYGATKAWVNTFTQALAKEGKPLGIRVFAIGPGAVETQMLRGALPDIPEDQTLDPDDIAGMVEWLLDDRCRNATGQTIYVRK